MPPITVVLWVANVALETLGHLAFKSVADAHRGWAAMLRAPRLWCGVICFGLQFVAWLALLSLVALSQAMLVNSISIVVIMLAGRVVFGERLDPLRVTGASLITIGVALAGAPA